MSIEQAIAEIMAARQTFRVGDRVRVRLNGECQAPWTSTVPGHDDAEDGMVGRVVHMPSHLRTNPDVESHSVGVAFDGPGIVIDGAWWWGSAYAPEELELLPQAPDARRQDQEA